MEFNAPPDTVQENRGNFGQIKGGEGKSVLLEQIGKFAFVYLSWKQPVISVNNKYVTNFTTLLVKHE